MRLYSVESSTVNLGNSVEDARIEIADLRRPVLDIEAFATGTLETIRTYAQQSPINSVLGGQLDRVEVEGDASFDLSIRYPIQDKENYDFSTRIRTSGGVIRVAGFPAPVSELNGTVSISRNDVSSESLFGRFLGFPVDLKLSRIQDAESPHSVILEAAGRTTAEDLQSEFGMPFPACSTGIPSTGRRCVSRTPSIATGDVASTGGIRPVRVPVELAETAEQVGRRSPADGTQYRVFGGEPDSDCGQPGRRC